LAQVALKAAVFPEGVMHPPLPLDQIDQPKLPTLPVLFDEHVWVPGVKAGPVGQDCDAAGCARSKAAIKGAAAQPGILAWINRITVQFTGADYGVQGLSPEYFAIPANPA
jgi:hypothetical protein